jgi:hypothetical protein
LIVYGRKEICQGIASHGKMIEVPVQGADIFENITDNFLVIAIPLIGEYVVVMILDLLYQARVLVNGPAVPVILVMQQDMQHYGGTDAAVTFTNDDHPVALQVRVCDQEAQQHPDKNQPQR